MKKMFTTITSFGTITGLTSTFCDIQENTNFRIKTNHVNATTNWENVGIKHNVDSQMIDAEKNEDTKIASKATVKISWADTISKTEVINAHGRFALVIDTWAKYDNILELKLDKDQSNDNSRIWNYDYGHSRGSDWGCLTSKIRLTLKATYDSEEEITSLEMISYIYAKPVTLCFAISQIDNIQFIL